MVYSESRLQISQNQQTKPFVVTDQTWINISALPPIPNIQYFGLPYLIYTEIP